MNLDRRRVLRIAGSLTALRLAGCSAPFGSRPKLDVTVENYRDETVELLVEVVPPDASDRSQALVYQDSAEVPPDSVGDDAWRASDVAPARRYRIEVTVLASEKTYHYHYLPDCDGRDAPYDPRVNLILNESPGVAFDQTTCSGDVASAP